MKKIEINLGDEYKIKVENSSEFSGSIFIDLYEKSAKNVDDIICQSLKKREWHKKNKKSDFLNIDDYNNVIAFTGERGSGKSSSMVSFANSLVQNSFSKSDFFKDYNYLNKAEFLSIEIIDPSLFNDQDTLLEIIISKMFLKFQKRIDKSDSIDIDYDKKRLIVGLFQKVFDNLKTLHNEKTIIYEQEAIEALSKLANGTNLKENFRILIDNYLDFFNTPKGFLLLAIDDFDLNIKGAYPMLENIRQYLIQNNILILIACKIEQLQDSIEQTIIVDYKELSGFRDKESNDSPAGKAIKYLEKLFPIAHRIVTPQITTYLVDDIKKKNDEIVSEFVVKNNNITILATDTIEEGILQILYKKNNLFISKSNQSISFIVPETIRELSNVISFLYSSDNIIDFKNYLLSEIKNNLSSDLSIIFFDLEKHEIKYLNQYIANWLGEKYPIYADEGDYLPTPTSRSRRVNTQFSILKASNPYNSSFGDILYLLQYIEKQSLITDKDNYEFVFYLKLYYSIRYKINYLSNKNSIYTITTPFLINEVLNIFPLPKDRVKKRENFIIYNFDKLVEKVKNREVKIEIYYWISFFVGVIGEFNSNYRMKEQTFYETAINQSGAKHTEATYNWFSFVVTSLEPNLIKKRLLPQNLWQDENTLYESLVDWNNLNNRSEYNLLFNIFFFEEMIAFWSEYSFEYREALGNDYEEVMFTYFSDSALTFVFDSLNKKYPYLQVDKKILNENPIIVFWKENRFEIKKILNEIYESKKGDIKNYDIIPRLNTRQKEVLNFYLVHLPNRTNKKTTVTRFIKKLKEVNLQTIDINEFQSLRSKMNNENEKVTIDKIIEKIENLLDSENG